MVVKLIKLTNNEDYIMFSNRENELTATEKLRKSLAEKLEKYHNEQDCSVSEFGIVVEEIDEYDDRSIEFSMEMKLDEIPTLTNIGNIELVQDDWAWIDEMKKCN